MSLIRVLVADDQEVVRTPQSAHATNTSIDRDRVRRALEWLGLLQWSPA